MSTASVHGPFNSLDVTSGESLHCDEDDTQKWWDFFLHFSSHPWAKKSVQLYVGTMVLPLRTTSWEKLQSADELTTWAIVSRLPTFILLYLCLSNPKHQSGANFMWPTRRNECYVSVLFCDRVPYQVLVLSDSAFFTNTIVAKAIFTIFNSITIVHFSLINEI